MKTQTYRWLIIILMGLLINAVAFSTASALPLKLKSDPVLPIAYWRLPNGTQVFFVQATELPMLDIALAYQAGASRDGNQPGIARFTNQMIAEGTPQLNTDQIAERFEGLGAIFSAQSAYDSAVITLRTLTNKKLLTPALDTLKLLIENPAFPETSFQRQQRNTLVAIDHESQMAPVVARQAFYEAIYGDQIYGKPILGTPESVQNLSATDLKNFYKKYYTANNMLISMVGNISQQQAMEISKHLTDRIPSGEKIAELPRLKSLNPSIVKHITFPSSQTYILIGQLGIARTDKDYFPLMVGNHILGGSAMTSRLFKEIRSKKALSYGVESYFQANLSNGPFIIALQTRNEERNNAIQSSLAVLQQFTQKGPTRKELAFAKQNILGSFPLRLDSNASILNQIIDIGFYGLPLNYLDTYADKIQRIKVKTIKSAFKEHLDPHKMTTISVGG